jgi:hypothetical protein
MDTRVKPAYDEMWVSGRARPAIHVFLASTQGGRRWPGMTKTIARVDGADQAAINRPRHPSRFSSAVEQRFCKPKVGSSILSTGTTFAPYDESPGPSSSRQHKR